MQKLLITIDGQEKTILANEKYARGIYLASDTNLVRNNITVLGIKFEQEQENVIQNRITKIGSWSFLTSKVAHVYLQWIFMKSASEEDFEMFLEDYGFDSQLKNIFRQAFVLRDEIRLGRI